VPAVRRSPAWVPPAEAAGASPRSSPPSWSSPLLLYSDATTATEQWPFNERFGETLLSLGFAEVSGVALPQLLEELTPRHKPVG
jgi:hypothetical protein